MKIATGWSTAIATKQAVTEAYQRLQANHTPPDLIIVNASVAHQCTAVLAALQALAPAAQIQGSTSCLGVMTEDGFHSTDGTGLGLLGLWDSEGSYGIGTAVVDGNPRESGAQAIQEAIANAERFGETPDLVWIAGVPGHEEAILEGIQDVIGPGVPIAGGSSADNTVEGFWQQFANSGVFTNAVVVTAMYPSTDIHLAFHSGYSPTEQTGIATKSENRTLYEINGSPAATVYNEWTNGLIQENLNGGNILADTSLYPLGRQVGQVGGMPYHRLSHPDSVTPDRALTFFADIQTGDELILMSGTRTSLITRAGRVAQSALAAGHLTKDQIAGALVIYCAGCMLTVQNEMDQVAAEISDALDNNPFLGAFTFGEQGCFIGGENHHGNLMISVVIFEK